MAEFKIVLGAKDGKCHQMEIKDDEASMLLGKKVGDTIKGDDIGLEGYELLITGGSDDSGFPMRKDVQGSMKKKILAVEGIGLKKKRDGQRQRKTVAGNTIFEGTAQINFKILKEGKKKLGEEPAAEEAPEKKE